MDQDTRPPMRLLARVYGRSRTGRKGTERTSSTSTPTPVPWASRHERSSKSAYKNSQRNRTENQPKVSRVSGDLNRPGICRKSLANNKGGTGKTTTAVNLGTALAQSGRRVLLVDLDPQGSATVSFGFDKAKLLYTVYDVLAQSRKMESVVLDTKFENLSLVPSNLDLAGAEVELSSVRGREFVLREALSGPKRKYDVILLDCPPNIGILTVNAIVASDLLMVPV